MCEKENRTCRLCNEVKELEQFEIDSRREGLYTTRCKSCKLQANDKANSAFYKLRQRSENAGSKVEVTVEEVKALFASFDGLCIYCGAQEEPKGPTFHLEHVIPRSQGGRDHISNLVISCPSCNSRKHNKPVVSHYFDDKNFTDENLTALVYYISLQSAQPIKETLDSMVEFHADYQVARVFEGLDKTNDNL